MPKDKYVIGVDFGTDSVRTIIVNAITADEMAESVFEYPRWKQGLYCDAAKNQFRQHPLDYIEGLENTIKECVAKCSKDVASNIVAISIDTTGSTPIAVNEVGMPLSLLPQFAENPNAMFALWKDHTSIKEAEEISNAAKKTSIDYTIYCGGVYSSEWFWAKLLHILRKDDKVRESAFSYVEHCDWIPFLLTGGVNALHIKRGVCAAGHKGLWVSKSGGFPPDDFFTGIDPLLGGFVNKMQGRLYTVNEAAGNLCKDWADRLGLSTDIVIGIGAIDAHVGAIGGQIEPGYLLKVIGTSTCDMIVVQKEIMNDKIISGISGQVDGSIIPGMIGLEAGQAAFGDIYAWFKSILLWPLQALNKELQQNVTDQLLEKLSAEAAKIPLNENDVLAIDWMNGRRTPYANPLLKGAVTGLTLASDAPRIYKALVEATCFGSKRIVDRLTVEGVEISGIIGVGGIANKSSFVMQMLSDVLGMPIKIHHSKQTCAFGAAMMAATAGKIYPSIEGAMKHMGKGFAKVYYPDISKAPLFEKRYKKYISLCDFIEQSDL